jgi:hypothetical protein
MRFALVIAVLLTAANRAAAGEPAAGLAAEQSHLDLGRVTAGSTVSAEFVLHNRGSSPVRILRAAPS